MPAAAKSRHTQVQPPARKVLHCLSRKVRWLGILLVGWVFCEDALAGYSARLVAEFFVQKAGARYVSHQCIQFRCSLHAEAAAWGPFSSSGTALEAARRHCPAAPVKGAWLCAGGATAAGEPPEAGDATGSADAAGDCLPNATPCMPVALPFPEPVYEVELAYPDLQTRTAASPSSTPASHDNYLDVWCV